MYFARFILLLLNRNKISGKKLPELNYGITLGGSPRVIYFTKSEENLNIQSF
jgi:hypothetical protein